MNEPTVASSGVSLIDRLAALPDQQRREALSSLSALERAQALYTWELWARPDQREPEGDWRVWLLRSGRGAGKTRTGAEWVRLQVERGACRRIALVGRTADAVRRVMVEGESGILAISPPRQRPDFQPSLGLLLWPNGARALLYSAEEPDQLRGPEHDGAWCDELASWRDPTSWDNLMLTLRLGRDPRCVVTTTPRPTKLMRRLIAKPTTAVTQTSTYANRANLAPGFFADIVSAYENTRLGRQEIYGELLEDVPGALWTHAQLDELRVAPASFGPGGPAAFPWKRVVIGVDPAVSCGEDSDETGICVVALGEHDNAYVLADGSGRYSPNDWAKLVVSLYDSWQVDRVVAEVNNGGDLVPDLLHQFEPALPVKMVHASRGKVMRAEPVAALYDQGRVHHVGVFPVLEDQMATFTPDIERTIQGSPDRVDALVWALTHLLVNRRPRRVSKSYQG